MKRPQKTYPILYSLFPKAVEEILEGSDELRKNYPGMAERFIELETLLKRSGIPDDTRIAATEHVSVMLKTYSPAKNNDQPRRLMVFTTGETFYRCGESPLWLKVVIYKNLPHVVHSLSEYIARELHETGPQNRL